MIVYDVGLKNMLATDTPCGDMMLKEESMLQIIVDDYLIKVLKLDKQAKGWDYVVVLKGTPRVKGRNYVPETIELSE